MVPTQKSKLRKKVLLITRVVFACVILFIVQLLARLLFDASIVFDADEQLMGIKDGAMAVWFVISFLGVLAVYFVRCENCGMLYGFSEPERESIFDISQTCPRCGIERE